jgi:hypothetical protein
MFQNQPRKSDRARRPQRTFTPTADQALEGRLSLSTTQILLPSLAPPPTQMLLPVLTPSLTQDNPSIRLELNPRPLPPRITPVRAFG